MPNQSGAGMDVGVQNVPGFPGVLPFMTAGGAAAYYGAGGTVSPGVQIKTGEGRLCKVVVTAVGTGAANFYDGTSNSGQLLFVIPASAAIGTVYDLQAPFAAGLFYDAGTNQPKFSLSYD